MREQRIVDFKKWCPECKYCEQDEFDPKSKCYDCMNEPANELTDKPVLWKKGKKK